MWRTIQAHSSRQSKVRGLGEAQCGLGVEGESIHQVSGNGWLQKELGKSSCKGGIWNGLKTMSVFSTDLEDFSKESSWNPWGKTRAGKSLRGWELQVCLYLKGGWVVRGSRRERPLWGGTSSYSVEIPDGRAWAPPSLATQHSAHLEPGLWDSEWAWVTDAGHVKKQNRTG